MAEPRERPAPGWPPTLVAAVAWAALATSAAGQEQPAADEAPATTESYALHGQTTFTDQFHFAFHSPYQGPNSLSPDAEGRETWDVTIYDGYRPWTGGEFWVAPELDQGFGLNNTFGIAGFPSGEAYKIGEAAPYVRLQRIFFRQTIDLGGDRQKIDSGLLQLAGSQTENRLVFTVGKFSVTDIFDANDYAHDPRNDFLNWSIIDTGTFDYAADAWGYSAGGAAEWYQGNWTLRGAVMDLSIVPNSPTLTSNFSQFQLIGEGERRWTLAGRAGVARITGYWGRARMGTFDAAIALAQSDGGVPSTALVRRYRSRGGFGLDAQQALTRDLGVFARAGVTNGDIEPYEFTDIDRTAAVGLSLRGRPWGRPDDAVGLAGVINGITAAHELYFADGGLGTLIGDGQLPHPGTERILETFYSVPVGRYAHVTLDYQFVDNPAYNRDRGPVSILAARIHAQF
ncbi:MAG TPA: carbohydrate porin [Caulobacteraceae bacterium]|nr:carbohydrate porin [Caulobacteraceae bacterium]